MESWRGVLEWSLEWYCGVWSGRFGVILLEWTFWSDIVGVVLWTVEWTFWSGIWSDIVECGVILLEWYME